MNYRDNTALSASLGLLVLRVVLGTTFILHGWQKLQTWTIPGTETVFAGMGVPYAHAAATAAAYLEFVGGILLVAGLLSRLAGLLLALDMLGAWWFAHTGHGFFIQQGGFELVMVLAGACLAVFFVGPGRLAIAGAFEGRRGVGLLA